jgi:hypothetical protein
MPIDLRTYYRLGWESFRKKYSRKAEEQLLAEELVGGELASKRETESDSPIKKEAAGRAWDIE